MSNPSDRTAERSEPDPRLCPVPLPTADGDEVVIARQNVGSGNTVGAGEFERPGEAAVDKDPATAAEQQEELEAEAPTG